VLWLNTATIKPCLVSLLHRKVYHFGLWKGKGVYRVLDDTFVRYESQCNAKISYKMSFL